MKDQIGPEERKRIRYLKSIGKSNAEIKAIVKGNRKKAARKERYSSSKGRQPFMDKLGHGD